MNRMNNLATYSCTALMGTNKMGIIKPDSDGYYEMVLGGLDVNNSVGAFYPLAPAKELFEASSSLQRRISNGSLKGEYGHPKKIPGMSDRDFLARIMELRESELCCHFKEVSIVPNVKDKDGRSTVAIIGKVIPSGPHGPALQKSLENRHENVCFSIRSLTLDEYVGGRLIKTLKNIITWDYVNEPGIAIANKYCAPTLENLHEVAFTPEVLNSVKEEHAKMRGLGMESGIIVSADEIEKSLGWKAGTISARTSTKW